MKITLPFATEKFNQFNALIFDSKLPPIPIRLSDALGYIGQFVTRRIPSSDGLSGEIKYELRFSRAHDMSEEEHEDTIIHEMIHYYIAFSGSSDNAPHGRLFRKIMSDINTRFGRHLSITHKWTREEAYKAKCSRRKWHVIAVAELPDGLTAIKVLPRVVPKIIDFYMAISNSITINSVELFLSDAPQFNIYPVSTTNRLHIVDRNVIMSHLSNASRLYVENGKLVQR